jgi:hypothetical protein
LRHFCGFIDHNTALFLCLGVSGKDVVWGTRPQKSDLFFIVFKMSKKNLKRLPLQEVLDNFPCMISMVPTEMKTAFLCGLSVVWDRDNWEFVPDHLINNVIKIIPWLLDNGYGDGTMDPEDVDMQDDIRNEHGFDGYDKPYWENENNYVSGCVFCGKNCNRIYEGDEQWLENLPMCEFCERKNVNNECVCEESDDEETE